MRQSLEGWTPSSPPAVGRLSAHLGWVSFSRAWLGTGLESVTTKPPPSVGGSVHFDTAWSPPKPVIKRAAELYPALRFELRYFDCGCCFNGLFCCSGGEVVTDESGP